MSDLDTAGEYDVIVVGLGLSDPMGKPTASLVPLATPPFHAIESSIEGGWFGCPSITMGGLAVDEESGRVRGEDGAPIAGLYAAGRTAVGLPTENYVSGLSLSDCVFSGRRAGAHAAGVRSEGGAAITEGVLSG